MTTTDTAPHDWATAFYQRAQDHHMDEVVRGEHDDECEWRPKRHMLCHCPKRRRIAAGHTEPPGELIYRNPLCPRCLDEVTHSSDGFVCAACHVRWSDTNFADKGTFTDDYGCELFPDDHPAAGAAS